jgi:hypothetical protein
MNPENARRLALARMASPTTGPSWLNVRHLVRPRGGADPLPRPASWPGGRPPGGACGRAP